MPTHEIKWRKINNWRWNSACGRFYIERFVTGDHEAVGHDFTWPSRYRAFKRAAEWDGEIANESALEEAQRACERSLK